MWEVVGLAAERRGFHGVGFRAFRILWLWGLEVRV